MNTAKGMQPWRRMNAAAAARARSSEPAVVRQRVKPKGKSPTQRSLAEMRSRGFDCAVVEHWNPHVGIRQDMFGVWDIVCIKPGEIVFLQCTTDANLASRVTKITEHDLIDSFRKCGARLLAQGWKKRAGRWACREVDLS